MAWKCKHSWVVLKAKPETKLKCVTEIVNKMIEGVIYNFIMRSIARPLITELAMMDIAQNDMIVDEFNKKIKVSDIIEEVKRPINYDQLLEDIMFTSAFRNVIEEEILDAFHDIIEEDEEEKIELIEAKCLEMIFFDVINDVEKGACNNIIDPPIVPDSDLLLSSKPGTKGEGLTHTSTAKVQEIFMDDFLDTILDEIAYERSKTLDITFESLEFIERLICEGLCSSKEAHLADILFYPDKSEGEIEEIRINELVQATYYVLDDTICDEAFNLGAANMVDDVKKETEVRKLADLSFNLVESLCISENFNEAGRILDIMEYSSISMEYSVSGEIISAFTDTYNSCFECKGKSMLINNVWVCNDTRADVNEINESEVCEDVISKKENNQQFHSKNTGNQISSTLKKYENDEPAGSQGQVSNPDKLSSPGQSSNYNQVGSEDQAGTQYPPHSIINIVNIDNALRMPSLSPIKKLDRKLNDTSTVEETPLTELMNDDTHLNDEIELRLSLEVPKVEEYHGMDDENQLDAGMLKYLQNEDKDLIDQIQTNDRMSKMNPQLNYETQTEDPDAVPKLQVSFQSKFHSEKQIIPSVAYESIGNNKAHLKVIDTQSNDTTQVVTTSWKSYKTEEMLKDNVDEIDTIKEDFGSNDTMMPNSKRVFIGDVVKGQTDIIEIENFNMKSNESPNVFKVFTDESPSVAQMDFDVQQFSSKETLLRVQSLESPTKQISPKSSNDDELEKYCNGIIEELTNKWMEIIFEEFFEFVDAVECSVETLSKMEESRNQDDTSNTFTNDQMDNSNVSNKDDNYNLDNNETQCYNNLNCSIDISNNWSDYSNTNHCNLKVKSNTNTARNQFKINFPELNSIENLIILEVNTTLSYIIPNELDFIINNAVYELQLDVFKTAAQVLVNSFEVEDLILELISIDCREILLENETIQIIAQQESVIEEKIIKYYKKLDSKVELCFENIEKKEIILILKKKQSNLGLIKLKMDSLMTKIMKSLFFRIENDFVHSMSKNVGCFQDLLKNTLVLLQSSTLNFLLNTNEIINEKYSKIVNTYKIKTKLKTSTLLKSKIPVENASSQPDLVQDNKDVNIKPENFKIMKPQNCVSQKKIRKPVVKQELKKNLNTCQLTTVTNIDYNKELNQLNYMEQSISTTSWHTAEENYANFEIMLKLSCECKHTHFNSLEIQSNQIEINVPSSVDNSYLIKIDNNDYLNIVVEIHEDHIKTLTNRKIYPTVKEVILQKIMDSLLDSIIKYNLIDKQLINCWITEENWRPFSVSIPRNPSPLRRCRNRNYKMENNGIFLRFLVKILSLVIIAFILGLFHEICFQDKNNILI